MAGLTCTEFDDDSGATVIVTVLDDIIPGSTFSDPTCSDVTDDSIEVYLEVSATIPTYTLAGYATLFSWVSRLNLVVSDGSFTTAIIDEAAAAASRGRAAWAWRMRPSPA